MDRRTALTGAATLMAAAIAGTARAADEHQAHQHGAAAAGSLAGAASDCLQKGQVCLDHCLMLLGTGDTAMAGCARSVTEMKAICGALQQLANSGSKYLGRVAAVAKTACLDCAAECRKHAEKHAPCKDCMDSCEACARECEKVAA
jgi:Cys-rich four helix bundle protein (predicted Tat secretion target)